MKSEFIFTVIAQIWLSLLSVELLQIYTDMKREFTLPRFLPTHNKINASLKLWMPLTVFEEY